MKRWWNMVGVSLSTLLKAIAWNAPHSMDVCPPLLKPMHILNFTFIFCTYMTLVLFGIVVVHVARLLIAVYNWMALAYFVTFCC